MKMQRMFKMRITKLYLSVYLSMSFTKNTGKNVSRQQKSYIKSNECKNSIWSANDHVIILYLTIKRNRMRAIVLKNSIFLFKAHNLFS